MTVTLSSLLHCISDWLRFLQFEIHWLAIFSTCHLDCFCSHAGTSSNRKSWCNIITRATWRNWWKLNISMPCEAFFNFLRLLKSRGVASTNRCGVRNGVATVRRSFTVCSIYWEYSRTHTQKRYTKYHLLYRRGRKTSAGIDTPLHCRPTATFFYSPRSSSLQTHDASIWIRIPGVADWIKERATFFF